MHVPSVVSTERDPFWQNIRRQPQIGMLFIELNTRRRLRINGVANLAREDMRISVQQAYLNCPKYIQRREIALAAGNNNLPVRQQTGIWLNQQLKDWIEKADTLFVGSSDREHNMDASHRGGPPGFVKIVDDSALAVPDYQGNSMFNTLGNFLVNPNAGLLFVDFDSGGTLQLTGKVEIVWQEQTKAAIADSVRFWKFLISEWIVTAP